MTKKDKSCHEHESSILEDFATAICHLLTINSQAHEGCILLQRWTCDLTRACNREVTVQYCTVRHQSGLQY